MDKQVNSKQRVADHGEVFTAAREVNAMLDLLIQKVWRCKFGIYRNQQTQWIKNRAVRYRNLLHRNQFC